MQRIKKTYGFIVSFEIWWLNLKQQTSAEIHQALLYMARIQVMRAAKSKNEKQIIKIKIKIMHRMQQMPLVYKWFPYRANRDSVSMIGKISGICWTHWTSFNKNKSGCLLDYINILRNEFKNGKSSQIWEEEWAHRKCPTTTTGRAEIKEWHLLNNCLQQPRPPEVCDFYTTVCTF